MIDNLRASVESWRSFNPFVAHFSIDCVPSAKHLIERAWDGNGKACIASQLSLVRLSAPWSR